jgi:hypothetical protein
VGLTLKLLGAQIEAEELVSHYRDVYEVLEKKELKGKGRRIGRASEG